MAYKNIVNLESGKLTAISFSHIDKNGLAVWNCNCSCGNKCQKTAHDLLGKRVRSCGCLVRERNYELNKKYNRYDLSGEFGIGYTEKGYYFYFDKEDYDLIKNYCWCTKYDQQNSYIVSMELVSRKHVYLHKIIMNILGRNEVDHINGLKYDNRKSELRPATKSLNMSNRKIRQNNTSGYIGVYKNKRDNKWAAFITFQHKNIWLGNFINIEDALIARLQAELKYFGDFSPQKHLFNQYNIK